MIKLIITDGEVARHACVRGGAQYEVDGIAAELHRQAPRSDSQL